MRFDGWETQVFGDAAAISPGSLSESELMHWGIPGMKHGRRRYQNPDGSWTPLGLRERRSREGFGEGREARKLARAERKAAKSEARAARKTARAERAAAATEKRRKSQLKNLTDEELKAQINRLNMEKQYKELKQSPLLKAGMDLVGKYLDYKDKQEQKALELNRQKIEMARIRVQGIQARESAEKAKYEAKAARSEFKKKKQDVKGGLSLERQTNLQNAKTNYRNTTIRGAIGKHFNNMEKYRQELRMNPLEAKKHQRTTELQKQQIVRDRARTNAEMWKAEQEKHKAEQEKHKARGRGAS